MRGVPEWWARQPWSENGERLPITVEVLLEASLWSYLGTSGASPRSIVNVTVFSNRDLHFPLSVTGMASNCIHVDTDDQSCGVEIHDGTSCDDASTARYDASKKAVR
jgi:hypothetical protein